MYESPWILIIVAVVLFCAVSIFRNAKPEKAKVWLYLIPLIVLGAAFAIDHFVQTDNEKIVMRITTASDAIVARQPQTVINMIDEDYLDPTRLTKQIISNKCRQYLSRPFLDRIKINSNVITINGDQATSQLNVSIHPSQQSDYSEYGTVAIISAKLDFVRRGDDWFIKSLVIEKINNSEPPKW